MSWRETTEPGSPPVRGPAPAPEAARQHEAPGAGCGPAQGAAAPRGERRASTYLVRLFVDGVPKSFSEPDLKPVFDKWGEVRDVIILRDKATGQPRGSAFVSYATQAEADAAVRQLDRRVRLPGAGGELEVRFAHNHHFVMAGTGPENNRQLFFSKAPATAREGDVRAAFARFGPVEEVTLFRERRGRSKGSGFVRMASREGASAAMTALDGRHVMEGASAPLAVCWADPDLQTKKRHALGESDSEKRTVFITGLPSGATEEQAAALFSAHGRVCEVVPQKDPQGPSSSEGSALVVMGTASEAAAAAAALHEARVRPSGEGLVVLRCTYPGQPARGGGRAAVRQQGAAGASAAVGPRSPLQTLPAGALSLAAAFGGLAIGGPAARAAQRVEAGRRPGPVIATAAAAAPAGPRFEPGQPWLAAPPQQPELERRRAWALAAAAGGGLYAAAQAAPLGQSVAAPVSGGFAYVQLPPPLPPLLPQQQYQQQQQQQQQAGSVFLSPLPAPALAPPLLGAPLILSTGSGPIAPAWRPPTAAPQPLQQPIYVLPSGPAAAAGAMPLGSASAEGPGASGHSSGADAAACWAVARAGAEGSILTCDLRLSVGQVEAVLGHAYTIQAAAGVAVACHAVAPGLFRLTLSGQVAKVEAAWQFILTVLQGAPT